MDCVHHPGVDAPYQCYRCREFICVDCEAKVEGRSYCRSCLASMHQRLAGRYQAETRNISYPLAFLSGLGVAVIMAVLWSQVAVWMGFSLQVWPALLGAGVGWGIVSGTGGKRGEKLQGMALVLAFLGSVVGLFLVSFRLNAAAELGAQQFSSPLEAALSTFPAYLMQKVGGLDWLFVVVGLGVAYYLPHERRVPE